MIKEKDLDEKRLLEKFKNIINDEILLKKMSENSFKLGKRDAVNKIAIEIEKLGK